MGNQIYEFRLKILLCLRILKDYAPRNIATLSLSLSLSLWVGCLSLAWLTQAVETFSPGFSTFPVDVKL